jgi:Tol biopolymer transport system component
VIVSITAIALTAIVTSSRNPSAEPQIVKFNINPPDKMTFEGGGGGLIAPAGGAISPDGSKLAVTAKDESGKVSLGVRPLGVLSTQMFPGTDGASQPFWSADSKFIAFFDQGKLKKINAAGGPVQTICDAPNPRAGDWSKGGMIVFAPNRIGPIYRVPSSGGEAVAVTKLLRDQTGHRNPQFLPDGRHFLYFAAGTPTGVFVGSFDSPDGRHLVDADAPAFYAPQGYLLFVRQGTLLAQPFNPGKLQLSGEPVPVAEQVAYDGPARSFSVSENGTLAYRSGFGGLMGQLTLSDRTGKLIETVGEPGQLVRPDMSPDGKRIAVERREGQGSDIWLVETSSGKTSRFTFDAAQENSSPVWSPDGSRIAFVSRRDGKWGIYEKPSNQTGTETLLYESGDLKLPAGWSPDGKFLLFVVLKEHGAIWKLPLTGDRQPTPVFETRFSNSDPQISPNGKWIAYRSDETGRSQVYVQSFPPGAGKWQISKDVGFVPRWRWDGGELFYMDALSGGRLLSAETKTNGSTFDSSAPHVVLETGFVNFNYGQHAPGVGNIYSVSADGQRFALLRPISNLTGAAGNTPITIVLNWTAALAKK